MKKFIKLNFIFAVLSVFVMGCSPTKTVVDESTGFFDVVYQVEATRETSSSAWTDVVGQFQMKIVQNTATQGTWIVHYSNYKEPQFVYNTCSGGAKGNYVTTTAGTTTTTSTGNYDPSTTYTGSGTTTGTASTDSSTDTTDAEKVDIVYSYYLSFTPTLSNLDSACRAEKTRNVSIYRFTDGKIIMKSEYRELRFRPVLTSEEISN